MRKTIALLVLAACTAPPSADSEWIELAPMRVARSEHPALVADGELVVFGGLIETAPRGEALTLV